MNNMNNLNPTVSVIAENFNGKWSKWYSFDSSDKIGKQLYIITPAVRYS